MKLFRPYKSLKGYLERFTVLQCGKLHVRIHHLLTPDGTPFLHSHPFHYVSVVLSGGYVEKVNGRLVKHSRGEVIIRSHNQVHRIMEVQPNTKTLFITWKKPGWRLEKDSQIPDDWVDYQPGLYARMLYGKKKFCRFDEYWFRGHDDAEIALRETQPSIDQKTAGKKVMRA